MQIAVCAFPALGAVILYFCVTAWVPVPVPFSNAIKQFIFSSGCSPPVCRQSTPCAVSTVFASFGTSRGLLDTGKTTLYKWGAAPSYLVNHLGAQRIGTSGPPPGLSVSDTQEKTYTLTLREGQTLLLVSDGIPFEEALRICSEFPGLSPEEMGPALLQHCRDLGEDDATVVTLQLKPV